MASEKMTPDKWYELVGEGQRYAEELCKAKRWKDFLAYFRADYNDETIYFYNLIYAFISTLRPAIYFRDPRILITPWKTFGPDPDPVRKVGAQVLESVDNILIAETRLKNTMKDAIVDACICGRGIVKLGYSFEYYTPPAGDSKDYSRSEDSKYRTEFDSSIKNGMPWGARVSPNQFIVPFGTRRLETAPWYCHAVLRRTEDVRRSTYYKNVKDVNGTHLNLLRDWVEGTYKDMTLKDDWIEIHEIHSNRDGQVHCYIPTAEEGRQYIRGPEADVYQQILEGYNIETLSFNDDPDYFWSVPDVRQLEPQQIEMNAARQQAVAHRAISILKFIVQEGVFDAKGASEIQKLLSGNVAAFVKTIGDPEKIKLLQPHMPQDVSMWPEYVRKDATEVMGVGREQMGAEGGGRKTATEVQAIQLGHDMRTAERRDNVGECIGRIVSKWNNLVKKYWSAEDVVPIVGAEGAVYWVRFNNDSFKGSFKVRVDTDSMSPVTIQMRRQELMQVLQQGSSLPGFALEQVFKQLLSLYDWADVPSILPQAAAGPMDQNSYMQAQAGLQPQQIQQGLQRATQTLGARRPSGGE